MSEINARGARIEREFLMDAERYRFDLGECKRSDGWRQYDTVQDAPYFGVWVHPERRETVTFCEGDVTRVSCPTQAVFEAELASMAECYGARRQPSG